MVKNEIKTLQVNLHNRTANMDVRPVVDATLEEKLGGFGKAIHDIHGNLVRYPDLTSAFDPRNLLCIDIGFLTGSNLMTSKRTYVSALSPLKASIAGPNGIFYSAASGMFGPALRASDLDSVNIIGRASTPSYLLIDGNNVSVQDASFLRG